MLYTEKFCLQDRSRFLQLESHTPYRHNYRVGKDVGEVYLEGMVGKYLVNLENNMWLYNYLLLKCLNEFRA